MSKPLTKFEKQLIRGRRRQDMSIENIALSIKRDKTIVAAYLTDITEQKRLRKENSVLIHDTNNGKRVETEYKGTDMVIKPIGDSTGLDISTCGIMDIETGDWQSDKRAQMNFNTNVLCVSYYDLAVGIHTFSTIEAAIKFIVDHTSVSSVFAHNLRGFESLYIINTLNATFEHVSPRSQGSNANPFLFACKFKSGRRITFQDSASIIPYALANITSPVGFDTATKKGDLLKGNSAPYYDIDDIIDYNRSDCIGLYEALLVMEREIYEAFGVPLKNTVSSLGFSIFRKHYLRADIVVDKAVNKLLRPAYHGGAVMVLSFPHPDKNVLIVEKDINSSYPHGMTHPLPFPPYKTVYASTVDIVFKEEGFSFGTVIVPDDCRFPILSHTDKKGKLMFPVGTFRGLFAHPSLRFAIEKQRVKFVPEYAIVGTPRTDIRDYAIDLYSMRQRAGGNAAKRYTYKILLNSMYGRWGIGNELTQWITNTLTAEEWLAQEAVFDENFIPLKVKNAHSQAVVSIAAYTTDYGRVNLWTYLYELLKVVPSENICYFDTDAIFYMPVYQPTKAEWENINAHESDQLWLDTWIERHNVEIDMGLEPYMNAELGMLKTEIIGKHADIVTSKIYKITKLNGECIYRAKGFNTPELMSFSNMETWWVDLKGGKPIDMRGLFTFLLSSQKGGTNMVKVKINNTRQLRNAYDKRIIMPLDDHPLLVATTAPFKMGVEK